MTEEIPQWAIKRVYELMDAEYGKGNWQAAPPANPNAFARYIAKHEQPPVDPDLVKAREICARVAEATGMVHTPTRYRSGTYDNDPEVQFALSALKEARNA